MLSAAPLRKVAVSLCAAAELFANAADSEDEYPLATPLVAWTRQLTGFYGNRWQWWERYVRDQVEGINWSEFCSRALEVNPALA